MIFECDYSLGENTGDRRVILSSAGDVDGDGLSDILVPPMVMMRRNSGVVSLVLGSSLALL